MKFEAIEIKLYYDYTFYRSVLNGMKNKFCYQIIC